MQISRAKGNKQRAREKGCFSNIISLQFVSPGDFRNTMWDRVN